ncbi:MAG TPA: cytochrome c biogenesis protein CcdA [Candidatus Paceibacterota bacterium]
MKKLYILIAVAIAIFGTVGFLQSGNFGTSALWKISNEGKWLLPLVSIAALIDSINPCAFSILLLTIAFLFSLGKMRSGILKIGFFYISGLFVVYVLIGLGILQALHIFNTPHFMAKLGAVLLILFGLINLIGHYFPRFPIKLKIPDAVHSKIARLMEASSLPTAFFLGILVGLCEFPCTGGPYLLVLGLLHDQATYLKGLGYLLIYNLIFILPLALILLIASEQSLLDKVQKWRKENFGSMKLWSSLAMIGLGIIILFF